MKRFLPVAILAAACVTAAPAVPVFAADTVCECDEVFAAVLAEVEEDCASVTAVRKPVYDVELAPLGYVYEYTAEGREGYAVFTATDGFTLQEIVPDAKSPYCGVDGTPVYVSLSSYLTYSDGEYFSAPYGEEISDETLCALSENAFYGDEGIMLLSTAGVQIDFADRTASDYMMALQLPCYTTVSNKSACACIAGSNVLGFYDRYYDDLISDFTAGEYFLNMYYVYNNETPRIMEVADQLYDYMGTTDSGTSTDKFKKGMTRYCDELGFNISYKDMMSGGSINYGLAKKYIEEYNQPVALFVLGYNVSYMDEGDTYDYYSYVYGTANHTMVAFGYKEINYTYSSGKSETYRLFYVASCLVARSSGYFNLDYNSKVNEAFAINITRK